MKIYFITNLVVYNLTKIVFITTYYISGSSNANGNI